MRIRERATKNGARHHGAHSTFGGRDTVDWVEATGRLRTSPGHQITTTKRPKMSAMVNTVQPISLQQYYVVVQHQPLLFRLKSASTKNHFNFLTKHAHTSQHYFF